MGQNWRFYKKKCSSAFYHLKSVREEEKEIMSDGKLIMCTELSLGAWVLGEGHLSNKERMSPYINPCYLAQKLFLDA